MWFLHQEDCLLSQFSHSVVFNSLLPRGLQHAWLPCPSQLLELVQTRVHQVNDAIQPSHPLLSPSAPAFNLSQHWVFSNELALCIRWPKYWSFSFNISPSNEHPGPTPRTDSPQDGLVGSPLSPRDSQESSPTPQLYGNPVQSHKNKKIEEGLKKR